MSWPLVLGPQAVDGGVDLTQTLQNGGESASLSLKLLSALTHTWATSFGKTEGGLRELRLPLSDTRTGNWVHSMWPRMWRP